MERHEVVNGVGRIGQLEVWGSLAFAGIVVAPVWPLLTKQPSSEIGPSFAGWAFWTLAISLLLFAVRFGGNELTKRIERSEYYRSKQTRGAMHAMILRSAIFAIGIWAIAEVASAIGLSPL